LTIDLENLRTLPGHTDWVRTVAVSADGALLASGGSDRTVSWAGRQAGRLAGA
jgi:WD40 repeat protein